MYNDSGQASMTPEIYQLRYWGCSIKNAHPLSFTTNRCLPDIEIVYVKVEFKQMSTLIINLFFVLSYGVIEFDIIDESIWYNKAKYKNVLNDIHIIIKLHTYH